MKPVTWGILSTANIFGKALALPMRDSSLVDLYGIASRKAGPAEAVARKFGVSHWYGSYEALLDDRAIEAVYIPLPNHLHLEWIKRAADAGKHILCEKPLTMNGAEAAEAVAYTEKRGVLLMEAFMYRFHPQWVHARELIETGNIGTVHAVESFFSYSNNDPANIRNIREYGGGGLYDIGCYAVSAARFAFNREPVRALSLVNRDTQLTTDTLSSAVLDFGDRHSVFTVGTKSYPHQSVDIVGTSGKIHIDIPFNIHTDAAVALTVTTGVGTRIVQCGPADQYRLQIDLFSEAIRTGGPVPTPPSDALGNMRVLDALFRSETSGSWEMVEH
jgi:predicted dehydrogenase